MVKTRHTTYNRHFITHPLHCTTRSADQRGTKTFISATAERQQKNPIRLSCRTTAMSRDFRQN